jgi:hypothetical protein
LRTTRIVAAGAAALALAVPAAYAGTGTDGTHTLTLDMGASPARTSKPGKPQAVALSFKHVFVRNDGERAAAEYKRLSVALAKGFVIDPSAATQCKESVIAKSSKGCPSGSQVGTGKAIADARPSSPNPIVAPVKVFNGLEERDANGKPLATPRNALMVVATVGTAEVYFPAELRGAKFVVDFPKPASTALAAFIIKEISFKVRAITKGKKVLLAAPTACPKGGWVFSETDDFWSGAKTITAKDAQACS